MCVSDSEVVDLTVAPRFFFNQQMSVEFSEVAAVALEAVGADVARISTPWSSLA